MAPTCWSTFADAGNVDTRLQVPQGTDEDYKDAEVPMRLTEDEIVASLPPWTTQITLRACVVGVVLGVLFQFVTMRFALGPGGVVPTFNMPMGVPLSRGNTVRGWPRLLPTTARALLSWQAGCRVQLTVQCCRTAFASSQVQAARD